MMKEEDIARKGVGFSSAVRQYSTFHVDRFLFGIEVEHVQEVLQPLPATPVPLTTRVVDGLINLRGHIVLAIDLRARFGLPERQSRQPGVSIIVRTPSGLVRLGVDRLGDVVDCQARTLRKADGHTETKRENAGATHAIEALPSTVTGPMRDLIRGVVQSDNALLLIVDPTRLADPASCVASEDSTE